MGTDGRQGTGTDETDGASGPCPFLYAMGLIGQKWKMPVIWYIARSEPVRYNELRRAVAGITPTMLAKCLSELERDGLVERREFPESPPHVEYSLAPDGRALLPALREVYAWGRRRMLRDAGKPDKEDTAWG